MSEPKPCRSSGEPSPAIPSAPHLIYLDPPAPFQEQNRRQICPSTQTAPRRDAVFPHGTVSRTHHVGRAVDVGSSPLCLQLTFKIL